jgi:hypothetical protein
MHVQGSAEAPLEGYASPAALRLAHRASTAFLALSLRSSGVMAAARAGPPFLPPLRPRATAAGSFRFAMSLLYVSDHEEARRLCLTIRERSRTIKE